MLYRFRERFNYSWQAREGNTRLEAACALPIGSWECIWVEDEAGVYPYEPRLHDR